MDYSILPASSAEEMMVAIIADHEMTYTYTDNVDEELLYATLNERLTALETSMTIDLDSLQAIIERVNQFRFSVDEREEILLRIDWLERLATVQQQLSKVQSKEVAQSLKTTISSCQTSPLKNQLIAELDELIIELSPTVTESMQVNDKEALMERAIEEAGERFINLGKAGRDFIIAEVLGEFGSEASIQAVQERSIALEDRVRGLADEQDSQTVVNELERLPLPPFQTLSTERKAKVGKALIENYRWNGLLSLERIIVQIDKAMTLEEQQQEESKNVIHIPDGKAALTLGIEHFER